MLLLFFFSAVFIFHVSLLVCACAIYFSPGIFLLVSKVVTGRYRHTGNEERKEERKCMEDEKRRKSLLCEN